jgi:hypothetical protein
VPYETDFDTAFTILLGKAQGTITTDPGTVTPPSSGGGGTIAPTSYVVAVQFGGGGAVLTTSGSDPRIIEVPDPGELVWVHMYAGDANAQPVAVTATVDLQRTRLSTFGGSSPVYGSGTAPSLSGSATADMSLAGWFPHFESGDTLIARLTSFSGTATWVAMMIKVRRDATAQQQFAVLDSAGDAVLDAFGNPVIYRN